RGSVLVNNPATLDEGRALLSGMVERAEKAGEWVLAARAINNLVFELPTTSLTEQAELLERMRADAERAGFEAMAVAAYFAGRAAAQQALGPLLSAVAAYGKHNGDLAHDLISAALFAGLPRDQLHALAGVLVAPVGAWHWLIDAQLAEAEGRTADALAGYLA